MTSLIATPPLPGDQVASYTLIESLGVGGNATVYKARSESLGNVALKILHPGKTTEEDIRRFRREFLSLEQLEHPNIVKVYESGVHKGYPWISMEFVEGTDLDSLIKSWADTGPEERFGKLEQVLVGLCKALDYVHRKGMIHRDLKPSNVLIDHGMTPKLTDFGVVKAPATFKSELTTMGRLVGTVAFMAPEHIMGEKLDYRADLYSLGALLYMGLTGEKPFEAPSIAGYLAMHLTQQPARPREKDPTVPQHLDLVCMKLLQKEPVDRYSSAQDVLLQLEQGTDSVAIVGQDSIFSAFGELVEKYREGQSLTVTVTGGPRMGKTSVMERMTRQLQAYGIECHVLSCLADLPSEGPKDAAYIVDDSDRWKEEEQLQLCRRIRSRKPPGNSLVVNSIAERKNPISQGLATRSPAKIIRLAPLCTADVETVLKSKGLSIHASPLLSRRLCRLFQGNPGYILEALDLLVEGGWLKETGGILQPCIPPQELKGRPIPLPVSLQRQLHKRLAILSSESRHILECLVVLGTETSLQSLVSLTDKESQSIGQALRILAENKWLELREEGTAMLVEPDSQALAQLYMMLSEERRIAWHRRIAAVFCRRGRRMLSEVAEQVAHHLMESKQPATALPFLLTAAQRKARQNKLPEARHILRQAQSILPKVEGEFPEDQRNKHYMLLYRLLARDAELRGSAHAALEHWKTAFGYAELCGNPRRIAQTGLSLCSAKMAVGESPDNIGTFLAEAQEGDPMRLKVLHSLAFHRLEGGATERALEIWEELKKEEGLAERTTGEAGRGLGLVLEKKTEQGLKLIEQNSNILDDRWILCLAELQLAAGWWQKAQNISADLAERARASNDPALCSYALGLQSGSAQLLGNLDQARHLYHIALSTLPGRSDPVSQKAAICLMRVGLDLGESPPLDQELSEETPLILRSQWEGLCYRAFGRISQPPSLLLPWVQAFSCLDYLYALAENSGVAFGSYAEEVFDILGSYGFSGMQLKIAKLATRKMDSEEWDRRLQELIGDSVEKHPEQIGLRIHWEK